MISFRKGDWPQLQIGRRRERSCWFGWTWNARAIEVWIDRDRIGGHFWWLSFWVTYDHLTLSVGPATFQFYPRSLTFLFSRTSDHLEDVSDAIGALLLCIGGVWLLLIR